MQLISLFTKKTNTPTTFSHDACVDTKYQLHSIGFIYRECEQRCTKNRKPLKANETECTTTRRFSSTVTNCIMALLERTRLGEPEIAGTVQFGKLIRMCGRKQEESAINFFS